MAMLLSTLLALVTFGAARGFDRDRILAFAEESLPPIASVLLVVGAGGGFGRVLDVAGVDTAIAQAMGGLGLSPLVLGWVHRVAAARLGRLGDRRRRDGRGHHGADRRRPAGREPRAAGRGDRRRLADRGHVNDGGFWLVKEYLNTTVPQTLSPGPSSRPSSRCADWPACAACALI